MTESEKRAAYIENEKVTLLVTNLASSMPATIINCIILSVVLWGVVPQQNIIIWTMVNILFVFIRYAGLWMYKKGVKKDDFRFWQTQLLISFVIAGLLFGLCGFFLVNPDRPEYVIFLYFVVGGMVAGALGSYHNYLPVFFGYSTMLFSLPTIAIYNIHGATTTPMALLGTVFFILSAVHAKKMNQDLSEALALRYDNNQLIEKLNMEKQNTEKLNAKLMAKNHELQSLTRMDPLTGLKNRRYLFEVFTPENTKLMQGRWLEQQGKNKRSSSGQNSGYGIFMMDIDKFKRVNDNYGHDSGDMILEQFSAKLVEQVRDDDVVARIGGEEFVIILKNSEECYLDKFAEKLRCTIEQSAFYITQARQIPITCSIGYVFYPLFFKLPMSMNFDQMISLADKGLYHAKESGRNLCVRIKCTERETDDPEVVQSISSDVNHAIEQGEIYFYICPPSPKNILKQKRKKEIQGINFK